MKRLREDLHRYRLLLPCALAAVMLLRWAVMRGRAERVMELPIGPMSQWAGIGGGQTVTYGASANGQDLIIEARALDGSSEKTLVRHPSSGTDAGAFVSGPYLYYVNVWYRDPLPELPRKGGFVSSGVTLALRPQSVPSSFSGGAKPGMLGLLSPGQRGRGGDRLRTTLHRVPLAGGPPEEIHLDPGKPDPVFWNVAVVGNTIFWTRRRPLTKAELAPFTGKSSTGGFPPSYHELLSTPVSGGRATLVHGGLYQYARLLTTSSGAYWRVARPEPKLPTDVVYAPADLSRLEVRKQITFDTGGPPVECGGRIYWINDPNGPGSSLGEFNPSARRYLVSANPDLSDVRVVLHLDSGGPSTGQLTRIMAYNGRLYGATVEERQAGRESGYAHYLCEIDLDSDLPIRKLTRLPKRISERGTFDSGYYYFMVNEPQESLFDWSPDVTRPDRFYLYRWKLGGPNSS